MRFREVLLDDAFFNSQYVRRVIRDPEMPQTFWWTKYWFLNWLLWLPNKIRLACLMLFKWERCAVFKVDRSVGLKGFYVVYRDYRNKMFILNNPLKYEIFQMLVGRENFEVILLDYEKKPVSTQLFEYLGNGQSI